MLLRTIILSLLWAPLPFALTTPTFKSQFTRRGLAWDNEGLLTNVTSTLDPPQYSYEDRFGTISSSRQVKRGENGRPVFKRDGTLIRQTTERPEVKFWSQGPGQLLQFQTDFVYLDYAGSGATVYVHDTGLNKNHIEFTGALPQGVTRGTITILQPGRTASGAIIPTVNGDSLSHGTCVVSKVIGVKLGIAKSANLTMVPLADLDNDDYMLAELQAIIEDIKTKKQKDPHFWAVILLSYTLGSTVHTNTDLYEQYREKYLAMVQEGALLIVPAGNDGGHVFVNEYPAQFAVETAFHHNMIVVGSVDVNGNAASSSQRGSLVQMWAPGLVRESNGQKEKMKCASGTDDHGYSDDSGTCLAAPQVAGLAAYLYSIDASLRGRSDVSKIIKERIVTVPQNRASYMRGNVPSIWKLQYGNSIC